MFREIFRDSAETFASSWMVWFGDFDGLSNFLEVMTSDLENFWCAGEVLAFFGARKKCFNRRFCRVLEFFVVGL